MSPSINASITDRMLGPFCQISSVRSSLPQGLCDPPAYSPPKSTPGFADDDAGRYPPSYSSLYSLPVPPERDKKGTEGVDDVLHFLNPEHDTLQSLSLRYGVPIQALRQHNGLFSDNLLAARKTILIPGEFYKEGVSLSPRPVEGEAEELRKSKVRRLMVACKVSEYVIHLFSMTLLKPIMICD
jgi:hypothetical protein